MEYIKHNYSGASILELRKKYDIGGSGFYEQDWYLEQSFAKEKPKKGVYDVYLLKELNNLTFKEQCDKIGGEENVRHPAIIVEAVLEHFKKTGKRLLEDYYVRTSSLDSGGSRVRLGLFDVRGLYLYGSWDDLRHDFLAVSSARNFSA